MGSDMDQTCGLTTPVPDAVMPIKGEAEFADQRGILVGRGVTTRNLFLLTGRGEVTSLFTLSTCRFVASHNDLQFQAPLDQKSWGVWETPSLDQVFTGRTQYLAILL